MVAASSKSEDLKLQARAIETQKERLFEILAVLNQARKDIVAIRAKTVEHRVRLAELAIELELFGEEIEEAIETAAAKLGGAKEGIGEISVTMFDIITIIRAIARDPIWLKAAEMAKISEGNAKAILEMYLDALRSKRHTERPG